MEAGPRSKLEKKRTSVDNPMLEPSEPCWKTAAAYNAESVDELTQGLESFWQRTGAVPGTISCALSVLCIVAGVASVLCGVMPRILGFKLGLETRADYAATMSFLCFMGNVLAKHVALALNPITRGASKTPKSICGSLAAADESGGAAALLAALETRVTDGGDVLRQVYALSTLFASGDPLQTEDMRWWFKWLLQRFYIAIIFTALPWFAVPVALLLDGTLEAAQIIVPVAFIAAVIIAGLSAVAISNTFVFSNIVLVRSMLCFDKELRQLSIARHTDGGSSEHDQVWSSVLRTRKHLRKVLSKDDEALPDTSSPQAERTAADFAAATRKYGILKRLTNEHARAWELYFLAAEPLLILCTIFFGVSTYEVWAAVAQEGLSFLSLSRAYCVSALGGFYVFYCVMVWFSAARITAVGADLQDTVHEVLVGLSADAESDLSGRSKEQIEADVKSARKLADVMKMGGALAFSPYGFRVRASSALTMFYAFASVSASVYMQVILVD